MGWGTRVDDERRRTRIGETAPTTTSDPVREPTRPLEGETSAIPLRPGARDEVVPFAPAPLLDVLRPLEPSRGGASRAAILGSLEVLDRRPTKLERHAALRTVAESVMMLDDTERHQLLDELGPKGAAALARALGFDGETLAQIERGHAPPAPEAQGPATRALLATIARHPTAAGAAFVGQVLAHLCPRALFLTDGELGRAIAAVRHPKDAATARAEGERLAAIFGEPRLRPMLVGDSLHPTVRRETIALVVADAKLTRASLLAHDVQPWLEPRVQRAGLMPRAEDLLRLRGDEPSTLLGSDLENTIGAAFGLRPQGIPRDETAGERAEREAQFAAGRRSYFEGPPAGEIVAPIAAQLRAVGGESPAVTVLPIRWASERAGAVDLVLFRVRDAKTGADRFVDNAGRAYASFDAWRAENQLPPGKVTFPVDGHLARDDHGVLMLASEPTHATIDTPAEVASAVLDAAALVGGTVAGAAMLIGTGGAIALVGVGATAWLTARSGERLVDRATHGQSLDPIADEGARGEWLSFGAGMAGLGVGATERLAVELAGKSGGVGLLARVGYTTLALTTTTLDAATAAHDAHQLLTHWDELDGTARAELALAIGFWGLQTAIALRGVKSRPFDVERTLKPVADGHDALPRAGTPRNTVGWSGTPVKDAPAGAEHLAVIHRGQARLEAVAPNAAKRIRALIEPDPALIAELQARADRHAAIYGEHGKLLATPEAKLTPEQRALRTGIEGELKTLEAEIGKLQAKVEVQRDERPRDPRVRARIREELAPVMRSLRARVSGRKAFALTSRVKIDPSVRDAGVSEAQIRKWLAEYYGIVGDLIPPEKLKIVYAPSACGEIKKERPFYDPTTGTLNVGQTPSKDMLFHELTHALEYLHPELQQAARTWRDARADAAGFGPERYKLAEITGRKYGADEEAVRDHWLSPYTGKVYEDGATEVLSTGAESMSDLHRAADLFVSDPEHFLFMLGAM